MNGGFRLDVDLLPACRPAGSFPSIADRSGPDWPLDELMMSLDEGAFSKHKAL